MKRINKQTTTTTTTTTQCQQTILTNKQSV